MTPQQLMDLPGYLTAQSKVIEQKNWDYDYPSGFIERIQEITKAELTEYQRQDLIDLYEETLEGYP